MVQDPRNNAAPPINAFRFEAPLEFAKQPKDAAVDTKSRAIKMLARSKKVINHWWWGRCVHDFAGMQHADRIILDYCHDCDDIIGYADQFIVDDSGLTLIGRVESIEPMDEAEKLLLRMDKGIPYQSSIFFDEAVIEWVPDGFSAEVNGETIPGPLCVFRKWLLRASSACPHGYDSESNTTSEKSFATKFSWINPMNATNSPANSQSNQQSADPRDELTQFVAKFGTDGVGYFQNKLSMNDAALAHIDTLGKRHTEEMNKLTASHTESTNKLTAELDSAKKDRDEAVNKLKAAQLSHGEPNSIDTGSPKTDGKEGKTGFSQFIRPQAK